MTLVAGYKNIMRYVGTIGRSFAYYRTRTRTIEHREYANDLQTMLAWHKRVMSRIQHPTIEVKA